MSEARIRDGIIGLVTGDALGVPVEFKPRSFLRQHPVTAMVGFGTHSQPPGTWSDDSSMVLCAMDVMREGFDLKKIAARYCDWCFEGVWTPHGSVFDVGVTTRLALDRFRSTGDPLTCGEGGENSNGNGSLMRILPFAYYFEKADIYKRMKAVHEVAGITHAHLRSKIGSSIFVEFCIKLMAGHDREIALRDACRTVLDFFKRAEDRDELQHYDRILSGSIASAPESAVRSSGYVVDTLEAAVWCLMRSSSYRDAVLTAVNLGEDTDTVGAVTGALAGIYYGCENIPAEWREQLARGNEIDLLVMRFAEAADAANGEEF